MQMQSIISILLAGWLGLGFTLGPRFQCSCADGTQTVEIGNRFCCDDDSGMDQDVCDESFGSEMCSHDGCKSTLIQDSVLVSSDRGDEEQTDPLLLTDQLHYTALYAQAIFPSPDRQPYLQHRCAAATDLFQIRSVVLRV